MTDSISAEQALTRASAQFGQVYQGPLTDPSLTARARSTYSILALHADRHTRSCRPSRKRIAEMLGVSLDTVSRAIADLVKAGWLLVKRTRGYVNRYKLLDVPAAPAPAPAAPAPKQAPAQRPTTPRYHAVADQIASGSSALGTIVEEKPYTDEHGPLVPRCREHAAAPTSAPCRGCGHARQAYEAAAAARGRAAADRERERSKAYTRPAERHDLGEEGLTALAIAKATLANARTRRKGALA